MIIIKTGTRDRVWLRQITFAACSAYRSYKKIIVTLAKLSSVNLSFKKMAAFSCLKNFNCMIQIFPTYQMLKLCNILRTMQHKSFQFFIRKFFKVWFNENTLLKRSNLWPIYSLECKRLLLVQNSKCTLHLFASLDFVLKTVSEFILIQMTKV